MRVVLYCRVASPDQANAGLESQEQCLRKYAEEQGYEITGVIEETGSGLSMDRPGIREIYAKAEQGAMDRVLAQSLCRYTRAPASEFFGFIKALAGMGITASTLHENYLRGMFPTLRNLP